MIDDKKLISAFIYSAYDSGYCGNNLSKDIKMSHMNLYKDFISDNLYFPQKEINNTQAKMMNLVESTNLRDYVYGGHFDVVKKRIEEETRKDFSSAIKHFSLIPAMQCPISFYEVIEAKEDSVRGRNLFLRKMEKDLSILDGLERPKVGDIISGHWNHFLEIVNEWEDLNKYKNVSESYFNLLRKVNNK